MNRRDRSFDIIHQDEDSYYWRVAYEVEVDLRDWRRANQWVTDQRPRATAILSFATLADAILWVERDSQPPGTVVMTFDSPTYPWGVIYCEDA